MKKRIRAIIVWTLILAIVTCLRVFVASISIDDYVSDYYALGQKHIVSENMGHAGNLYVVWEDEVSQYFSTREMGVGIDIIEVFGNEKATYALVTKAVDGKTIYDIVEFDKRLKPDAHLGWVRLSQKGTVTDIEVYDSVVYLSQLSDDGTAVYSYRTGLTSFQEEISKLKPFEKPTSMIWNATETIEPKTGVIFKDAYLYNGEITGVVLQEESSNTKESVVEAGSKVLKKAKFVETAFWSRFLDLFIQMGMVLAVGIILIILVPLFLKKKNRFAYVLISWECTLCVICAILSYGHEFFHEYLTIPIVLAVGTACGVVMLWFQAADLRSLARGMRKVVENNGELEKPEVYGQDMNFLWNALVELGEKIKKISYSKFQLYEAYYRFAPKGMEKILGKDSVQDVQSDDEVFLDTTVALVKGKLFSNEMVARDTRILPQKIVELISEYQENQKGVLVSMSADMYQMMFMFAPENQDTYHFGIEYHNIINGYKSRYHEGRNLIVFHRCNMAYGVVGTKQQSCQYVYSMELNEIERKLSVLENLGVDFVMTKSALDGEVLKPTTRFIGELELGTGERLELYQVLDAMTNAKRTLYMENKELFENGIDLLKQMDYYLARNAFAEELRVIPEDGVARYYLYLCERYLENPVDEVSFVLR